MTNDEKVYRPEVIEDIPLPGMHEDVSEAQAATKTGQETYTPQRIQEKGFPLKRIALELLSTALNTASRKILQTFDLVQTGGFQIGKYQEGESGDVRITPAGITARDSSGNTTFALDGETGDAVFAGQVRAGSTIVSNTIVTEEASSGNGRTVYYNDGLPSIVIGDPS